MFSLFSRLIGTLLYEFVEQAVSKARRQYKPDEVSVGLNDGPAAGQTIPHVYWHIVLWYKSDIEDPTDGVRGVIPARQIY